MKKNFEDKKDLSAKQLVDIPEEWLASKDQVERAYQDKSDKFKKYKKKFSGQD